MYLSLLVAIGSAIGGVARYGLSTLIAAAFGDAFPWGTLIVNVSGCLVIGLFAALTAPDGRLFVPGHWRQFFMTGVCGGYTTFSSFSLQMLELAEKGQWWAAGANLFGSVAFCMVGVWSGFFLAGQINRRALRL